MDLQNIRLIGTKAYEVDGCTTFTCHITTVHFEYTFLRQMFGQDYKIVGVVYDDITADLKTTLPWDLYCELRNQNAA
jgi:hypothetical protein